jgi:hypothetical protein
VTVIPDPTGLPAAWTDAKAVVQVNREREVKGANVTTTHYYVTSHRGTAEEMAGLVRGHWGIEMTRSQYPPRDKLYEAVSPAGFECRPRDPLDFRPRHP